MKKIKVFVSVSVTILVSAGVVWAAGAIKTINLDATVDQVLSGGTNISISNNGTGTHTINFSGTLGLSNGGTGNSSFPIGSVIFSSGTALVGDNSNLFWDNVNKNLKVSQVTTNTVSANGTNQSISLNPTGTGKVLVGGGSLAVAQKSADPTDNPVAGQIYFNTMTKNFKGFNGNSWVDITTSVGSAVSLDSASGVETSGSGVNSISWTHVSNGANLLIVGLAFRDEVSSVSITYGGSPMTPVVSDFGSGGAFAFTWIFTLSNPMPGTNLVSANWNTSSRMTGSSASFLGANGGIGTISKQFINAAGDYSTSANLSVNDALFAFTSFSDTNTNVSVLNGTLADSRHDSNFIGDLEAVNSGNGNVSIAFHYVNVAQQKLIGIPILH